MIQNNVEKLLSNFAKYIQKKLSYSEDNLRKRGRSRFNHHNPNQCTSHYQGT